jgi:uncharacterized membrane protein
VAGRGERRLRLASPNVSWEDLVGGRVLGWAGGLAVLAGILFFLVVAASRGWIGEVARVLMAGGASMLLLAAGAWLHERRVRDEAALAAAATGIAGLFATAVVAGPVYDLVPAPAALAPALATGAAATALALRFRAPGIGWLGILGALASPALVGAATTGDGVALMLVAYAAAAAVLLWQRWHALAGAAFALALPQLAWWLLDGWSGGAAAATAALVVFGAVNAAAAAGYEWRSGTADIRISAHVLLALGALALTGLGALVFDDGGIRFWLIGLAVAHIATGVALRRSERVSRELSLSALALGVVLADVAFPAFADGLPLVFGWAAGAVAFAGLTRGAVHRSDARVAFAGLGGHLLLAIATALSGAAPLDAVHGGDSTATAIAALAAIAAGAWAAARLLDARFERPRMALDAIGLAALGLLSAVALDGVALTLALAAEAAALAAIARRASEPSQAAADPPARRDPLPLTAALAFLGAALAHALAMLAPPAALLNGLSDPLGAALGLAAVAAAAAFTSLAAEQPRPRLALRAGAALIALFLASSLLVTPFEREQGQALLSGLWALTGVALLVAGLARDSRDLRLAALALLTLTIAKVVTVDLASLTSLYRVASCIALGLLLLIGAHAWQRVRPRALPDLRDVPGALR